MLWFVIGDLLAGGLRSLLCLLRSTSLCVSLCFVKTSPFSDSWTHDGPSLSASFCLLSCSQSTAVIAIIYFLVFLSSFSNCFPSIIIFFSEYFALMICRKCFSFIFRSFLSSKEMRVLILLSTSLFLIFSGQGILRILLHTHFKDTHSSDQSFSCF